MFIQSHRASAALQFSRSLRAILPLSLLAIAAGCSAGPDGEGTPESVESTVVTYEEFKASLYREAETGIFIVDGDIPLTSEAAVREYYDTHYDAGKLIVHRVNNADSRWSDTAKRRLTYCVSTNFGARHAEVVTAMRDAGNSWERFSHVDFVYLPAHDANCTAANTSVTFDVRLVSNQPFLARAFFPHEARAARNVLIDSTAFTATVTRAGLLRHELGHALGWRHEHTRPEGPDNCFEDNSWRALTSYDPGSTMHYPQCNGTAGPDQRLTANDIAGARSVYGNSPKDFYVNMDFDGDGRYDRTVYRPNEGKWFSSLSGGGADLVKTFGNGTDILVPGDYDGDGRTDHGVYRDGTWFIAFRAGGADRVQPFGEVTDIPVPGDYDGDNRTDVAVWRPRNGTWFVSRSAGGADLVIPFGEPQDLPVPGDYDGDGKNDAAVFRGGTWFAKRSGGGADFVVTFGTSTDQAVPGDYDGDGITDAAFFRPSTGQWQIRTSGPTANIVRTFGVASDKLAPGDYDGDGRFDIGVWRPSNGTWFAVPSAGGADLVRQFGVASDVAM